MSGCGQRCVMNKVTTKTKLQKLTGILLWLVIAVYTFLLPNARLAYDAIVNTFGQNAAGRVPIITVCALGLIYALAVYRVHKSFRNLLFLIPCGVIAYLIMHLEKNPNKHIHIPEYVLMTWLLFAVLSKNYTSRDLYVLIFLCTTALGVVDELEQGIHPARFYGWSDMIVNSASGLIGIFTLMGIKRTQRADWQWARMLKKSVAAAGLVLAGLAGAVIMCVILFKVQAQGVFWGVYPQWLWIWNILYLAAAMGMVVLKIRKYLLKMNASSYLNPSDAIADLWVFPLLVIIAYMYILVIYVSITDNPFR